MTDRPMRVEYIGRRDDIHIVKIDGITIRMTLSQWRELLGALTEIYASVCAACGKSGPFEDVEGYS